MAELVRRYIYWYHFEYMTKYEANALRESCHKEMKEIAPDGTPEQVIYQMGETLYKMQLSPKI